MGDEKGPLRHLKQELTWWFKASVMNAGNHECQQSSHHSELTHPGFVSSYPYTCYMLVCCRQVTQIYAKIFTQLSFVHRTANEEN